ncbi:MAG: hypothetical protein M1837_000757 [Sclerophora amabilis]|nr:MAG: hypothetical protein M1837_000757 [Sclerophora amabilis]
MTTHSSRSSTNELTFYPAYCHPLSPTFNVWAKLTAADVHRLGARAGYEGQNVYFYLNHPIRWVRLVGVLVACEELDRRWVMVLDDSSGENIEVVCLKPRPGRDLNHDTHQPRGDGRTLRAQSVPDLTGVDLGAVVKVKGGVGTFRGARQIILKRISIVPSTTHEMQAWAELSAFRADVLSKPWVVSENKQRKMLDRATGKHKGKRKRVKQSEKGRDRRPGGIDAEKPSRRRRDEAKVDEAEDNSARQQTREGQYQGSERSRNHHDHHQQRKHSEAQTEPAQKSSTPSPLARSRKRKTKPMASPSATRPRTASASALEDPQEPRAKAKATAGRNLTLKAAKEKARSRTDGKRFDALGF